MNNQEAHIHRLTTDERLHIMNHLGETLMEAGHMLALPDIIEEGPLPVLGGVVRDGQPVTDGGNPYSVRVFQHGERAASLYSVKMIEENGDNRPTTVFDLHYTTGMTTTTNGTRLPLFPQGYRRLEELLEETTYSAEETTRAVGELAALGRLTKPAQALSDKTIGRQELRRKRNNLIQMILHGFNYVYPEHTWQQQLGSFPETPEDEE